jgi:prepilin-type N-terminal cleavage/methylation domain-containing protein
MKSIKTQGFSLVELMAVIAIIGLLAAALFPAISKAVLKANMTEVGLKGRDIYVAITSANEQRKLLGLGSVWPRTYLEEGISRGGELDICNMTFANSTAYFYKLYDGQNIGKPHWKPYVVGFDYSKLSGAGVPSHPGGARMLEAKYVMWTIAANINDEMDDTVPILITRNLDATQLSTEYEVTRDAKVELGKCFSTPFSNKGCVMIRKGGGVFNLNAKYCNLRVIYQSAPFVFKPYRVAPPKVYLTPIGEARPTGS